MAEIGAENRSFFAEESIVGEYLADEGLTPAEEVLVDRYVAKGSDVLDLGVGAGRTTAVLLPLAKRYVAIDYVPEMVEACRLRFPEADVREGDASDLRDLGDGEFDVVVFSFNGIDCIHPRDARARCLTEMRRVLRPGGVAILSSHNVHALVRPINDPPGLAGLPIRTAKRLYASARVLSRTVRGGAYMRGHGYVRDPATPLVLYMTSRFAFAEEAHRAGLRVIDIVGSDHPAPPSATRSAWFYYALRRP